MRGKITDAELLAAHAIERMMDIAKTEGHNRVPLESELVEHITGLPSAEVSLDNRQQDNPDQRGFIESRNISPLFRRR